MLVFPVLTLAMLKVFKKYIIAILQLKEENQTRNREAGDSEPGHAKNS